MQAIDEQKKKHWWAEGDTPVHTDSRVMYFVDGRITMLTMCLHFLKARNYIYLANWGMTPGIELVRGPDHRAGPDGSPEQEALLAWLRAEGLQEADIEFWCSHDLSVQAVLSYAVTKGVEVKVLLWESPPLPGLSYYIPKQAQEQLQQVGVTCLLDDSAHGILHHPIESLHQKISVVDGSHVFVGGVDLMIDLDSDFDRWDTPTHPFASPFRRTRENASPHPWHDAHALLIGPAAGDVELNFRQRWNDVIQRHKMGSQLLVPEHPPVQPLESTSLIQVARTIPEHTYNFDPEPGIQGIAQLYANAFDNVEQFVYLENQYFWLHAYIGIDIPFLGTDSPDMERNIRKLGEALRRGVTVVLVLPDHPSPGRAFTDAGLDRLRSEAPQAVQEGRLQVFCLGSSTHQNDGAHYRPIYVHAKVAIIDDVWSTVGSANLNNRGMRDDTEMNVAVLDPELAFHLRVRLWAEHLGLVSDEDMRLLSHHVNGMHLWPEEQAHAKRTLSYLQETIGNHQEGLRLLHERAWDNLRRYKAKQPLVGTLLPYLVEKEALQHGLNFREEHGWIEEPQMSSR